MKQRRTCACNGCPVEFETTDRRKIYCSPKCRLRAGLRRYVETHREQIRERQRRYDETHPEQVQLNRRLYRDRHREELRKQALRYYRTKRRHDDDDRFRRFMDGDNIA